MGELLQITQELTKNGACNKNTGISRITALRKFLDTIPGLENKNICEIEFDNLAQQYSNLKPGERWLNDYITRIRCSIRDYTEYEKNPRKFISKSRQNSSKKSSRSKKSMQRTKNKKASCINQNRNASIISDDSNCNANLHSPIYLQLRQNARVAISGIPLDMTINECKRLQALLNVYVKTAFEEK